MSRRSQDDTESRKPLRLWEPPADAGEPLGCLATTFTFDATFFETDCLGRFLGMETHPGESDSVGYLIEREEKLAAARVCVLVDRRHATSKESLRWDVLPVVVSGGMLHAKVSVLAWSRHVRVIVCSGNLTEPGYRKNVEVFGTLDISQDAGGPHDVILSVLSFLDEVVLRSVGDRKRAGPTQRAGEILKDTRRLIRDWPSANPRGMRVTPLFSGLGDSAFDQIQDLWPSGSRPYRADVLSPFFDREPDQSGLVGALVSLLNQRGHSEVMLHLPGERQANDSIRIQAPLGLLDAIPGNIACGVTFIAPDTDGENRPLHAKMLELIGDDCVLRMIGSSNFTTAGYGVGGSASNLEANLVYVVRNERDRQALFRAWPEGEELDLDHDNLIWEPLRDDEDDATSVAVLPLVFREALFCPKPEPQLQLALDGTFPERWSIRLPGGDELLSSSSNITLPCERVIAWPGPPPFLLEVRWEGEHGPQAASWPVNVTDPMELAPPAELRSLTLAELMQVLSSTRPLHEAIVQVLRRREHARTADDISLDPHQRINTENFLLQFLKRVAVALERMRERLERPAAHADAFRWRLFGPIGPKALATALRNEGKSPAETRFLIAELLLTLRRVRTADIAAGGLSRTQARLLLRECIDDIARGIIKVDQNTTELLDRYVAVAITEALQ